MKSVSADGVTICLVNYGMLSSEQEGTHGYRNVGCGNTRGLGSTKSVFVLSCLPLSR